MHLFLARVRPIYVLGPLIVVEWLAVLGLALSVRRNGWLFYQGGDQLWYYDTGWLLAHGHLPETAVGYVWPTVLLPFAALGGPNLLSSLPAIVVFNVLVLLPVAMLAVYGFASRIAGRIFGYWTLLVWIAVPFIGIAFTNAGYHQRYTELLLPQSLGLTVMGDFPAFVVLAVAAYFCLRAVQGGLALDATLAGVFAGLAIGLKASNALYLVGAGLALLGLRRWRSTVLFGVGLAPSLLSLVVWKWQGLGYLPIVGAVRAPLGLAAAAPIASVLNVSRYFHPDWAHFTNQIDLLREHFWSGRVVTWLPIAGLIGLFRKSPAAALIAGGWFFAFVFDKWTYPLATIEDSNLLRMMIPTIPAFVILLASIPLLVPGLPQRVSARPLRRLRKPRAARAVAVGTVALFCVLPAALAVAAKPLRANDANATAVKVGPIPTPVSSTLALQVTTTADGAVHLRWTSPATGLGTKVGFRLFRQGRSSDVLCTRDHHGNKPCGIASKLVTSTTLTSFVDRPGYIPRIGHWIYRVGMSAAWTGLPDDGDIYMLGPPITVKAP